MRYNYDKWKINVPWKTGDMASDVILGTLTDDASCIVHTGQDWGMWEDLGSELGRVRLHLSTPLGERKRIRREEVGGIYIIPSA